MTFLAEKRRILGKKYGTREKREFLFGFGSVNLTVAVMSALIKIDA
jgi:hypothetical protein